MYEMNHLQKRGDIVSEYRGVKVFQLPAEEFDVATKRRKGDRWSSTLGEKSKGLGAIRAYSLRNPGKPVIVQNEETGEMKMLRRRLNDQRLKHNRRKNA